MEPLNYEKRGYLNESFRLFHLADNRHEDIPYHYHSFHKIIILLAGKAGYAIAEDQPYLGLHLATENHQEHIYFYATFYLPVLEG